MTGYESSGQPWRDDPAVELIDAYHQHVSEELGTDSITPDPVGDGQVGHLVDENPPLVEGISQSYVHDTHDVADLAPEEQAMHYVDEELEAAMDELPESLLG